MLAKREDENWSLTPHAKRDYSTEVERRFFEAIENPPAPTDELKEMLRAYGKYTRNK